MSMAQFDDIYIICKEWENECVFEEMIMVGFNDLSSDSLTYKLTSRKNRLGELAEKEKLNMHRDEVLV